MAFIINHVVLVGGNLTRDAELKYVSTGNARLTFSVAMNRSYRDANDQLKEVTEYFDIVYWGKIAESVAPRLKKGQKVAVEGRLSWRRYTTQDGQQRTIVEVSATNVVLIGQRLDYAQQQEPSYGSNEYEPAPSYAPRTPPAQQQPAPEQGSQWNNPYSGSQQTSEHRFDDSLMDENDVPF